MNKITFKIFLLSLFLLNQYNFGQEFSVSGVVVDSVSGKALIGTNVIVLDALTSMIGGTASDVHGKFTVENLQAGKYTLKITFIGYKTSVRNFEIKRNSVDLQTIRLSQSSIRIGAVKVVETAPLVVQNKDTTEFMSMAVKTNKNATAEELLSKMPGITIQDGKVQSQGEEVTKVLIDGKPFFGDDPSAVLKNIPSELIEKIQVFDKQSEQSEFTGYDDGNNSKTINLVTRAKFRTGAFGKLAGGYGSDARYKANGSVNSFANRSRTSVIAQINNINEQNFLSDDLLGVMGNGKGMQARGSKSSKNNGKGINDLSNFLIKDKDGITSTKAIGANFITGMKKDYSLAASYFYNSTNNNSESSLHREYFLKSADNQFYNEHSNDNSVNINHRFNANYDFRVDSLNSFLIIPSISYQENNGVSNSTGNTLLAGEQLNNVDNNFLSNMYALNAGSQLLWRRRFETRGRTLSIRVENAYRKSKGSNKLFSDNNYFADTASAVTLDQKSDMVKNGFDLESNVVYTEPVSDNGVLRLGASYSVSKDKSDQRAYDNIPGGELYSRLDTSLSNIYDKGYFVNKYEAGYTFRNEGVVFSAGLSYNIASMKNEQSFPLASYVNRKFYSVLPSLLFRYYFSKSQSLSINYRSSNNSPKVEDLQNVLDNSNPLQLAAGNPDLVQDSRHSVSLRYTVTNFKSMSTLYVLLSGNFIQNYITRKTILAENSTVIYDGITVNPGTQLRIPVNMNGQYTLRSLVTYSFPFEFIESVIGLNFNASITRRPSVINDEANYSNTNVCGLGVIINSNISEDLDFSVSTTATYNNVKNSSRTSQDKEYFSYTSRIKLYWDIYAGLVLQTDFLHNYQGSIASQYDPNSYLWNLSIGKKLFDNERGEIRFTVVDLMNRNNNTVRKTRDTYIEDSETNVLGRYFMFSFIYNLRAF